MPGSQTRTKLKAFAFIEGKPSSNRTQDEADKENNQRRKEAPRQTPVKSIRQMSAEVRGESLPPSTPAMRLPLSDLIGVPEERFVSQPKETPAKEEVLWMHNATPTSSRPNVTPIRKRKRGKSSSPASSQPEPASLSREPFDVQRLQQSLKTPQADPAADLWSRYAQGNNGTDSNSKSTVFAHLLRDPSPGSSATKGSISGLRRWASCGVEWPVSATKNKRRRVMPREDESSEDSPGEHEDGSPKKSKVGLLLERMKESLSKPPEKVPAGPSSSSPLPERTVDERVVDEETDSPSCHLAAVREEESPVEESPVSQQFKGTPRGSAGVRKIQASSSEYGDDDIDFDMLEEIESTAVVTHSQPKPPVQHLPTIVEERLAPASVHRPVNLPRYQPPQIQRNQPQAPAQIQPQASTRIQAPAPLRQQRQPQAPFRPPTIIAPMKPQPVQDEFGDDDDLFAEDFELIASAYDSQATKSLPQQAAPQAPVPSKATGMTSKQAVEIFSDDEFGDDDIDDGLFAAAEMAATQAFRASGTAPLHSELNGRAIQRYLITMIQESMYTDDRGRRQAEKVIVVEEPVTKLLKNVILRQSWFETPCTVGSFVHITGSFDKHGQCIVDDTHNILVLHPDHLISATVVADSFSCLRRAVLQDRVKATGEASAPMMYGHMLHELFQEALKANTWDNPSLIKIMEDMLPRHYETMVEIGLSLNQVQEHIKSKFSEIRGWAEVFISSIPKRNAVVKGRSGQQSTMGIKNLLDVEEHIWSPNYGLKGNVDATIQVTVDDGAESRILTVPFELKTGKRVSENHFAQTALYTLLISDRYDVEVTDGILYYMETSQTTRVQAVRQELIHMIIKRNELACFVRERLKLPEMLPESQQRLCNNCYAQSTCFLYHKLAEGGASDNIVNKGKYEELVKYLKPADQDFFKKWDHLLTKEETEMKKFTRELWTMLSEQREKLGRCFGNVVIVPGSASELTGASKINRYGYTFTKQFTSSGFSFAESQITVGEPIVISDEKGHYALANGYVTQVTKRKISVAVDRSLHNARTRRAGFHSHTNQDFIGALEMNNRLSSTKATQLEDVEPVLYRLDKDEFANGMATARNNMLQIMNDAVFKAADLRAAIVNNREPRFRLVANATSLPGQSDMNSDQQAAVEKVMVAQDYALVLGMPGTGKTTTIAHIIRALVARGKSVLLTSYTHTAVDNILLKVRNAGFDILRLGVVAKIHPEVQEFAILGSQQKGSLQEVQDTWCNPPVVATTCLGINHALFTKRTFDYCIVDEASQITLPVCLGPLRMAKAFILVGDHFQLPPLVQNKEAQEGGLDMSLFRMLSEGHADAVVTLEHQYRMCEDVMLLSNRLIYSGRLKCGNDAVAMRSLIIPNPGALSTHHFSTTSGSMASQLRPKSPCPGPSSHSCHLAHSLDPHNKVLFFNTDLLLPLSAENASGNRITNPLEGALVTQFVYLFLNAGISASEIGVITFYRSQLALLRQNLKSATGSTASDCHSPAGGVELHTADKFQGRDKEVVIVSFVRSNSDGKIGELLKDWRRVNVALTRARSKLVLVGSKKTLLQGGDVLKGMVDICAQEGWLRDLPVGAGDGHFFSDMVGSQFDAASPIMKRKPVIAGKSPSKKPNSSPEKRRVLGEVTGSGNGKRERAPENKGVVGKKALFANRPLLRDIVNDVL
ncbi:hypothetical protein E6O75_ATG04968 [Venturia nashicola]|uniref:DNA replication ATP-dependent helicase/nuclease n=1 Tax=Venturia nashicola TaxID=86259 RepID=A0A4Z1P2F2_9PEZI|nr:hypothetical protein E6O75_ATG04968 [Venturia nashicola]